MRTSNSFIVTLLALISEVVLAWFGKPTGAATIAAGLYVGSRAGQKSAMVFASSRDEKSNTDDIIKRIEGEK